MTYRLRSVPVDGGDLPWASGATTARSWSPRTGSPRTTWATGSSAPTSAPTTGSSPRTCAGAARSRDLPGPYGIDAARRRPGRGRQGVRRVGRGRRPLDGRLGGDRAGPRLPDAGRPAGADRRRAAAAAAARGRRGAHPGADRGRGRRDGRRGVRPAVHDVPRPRRPTGSCGARTRRSRDWNPAMEAYADYDLVARRRRVPAPGLPRWRPPCATPATCTRGRAARGRRRCRCRRCSCAPSAACSTSRSRCTRPVRRPAGCPASTSATVAGTNHYTIALSPAGAAAVAAAVRG